MQQSIQLSLLVEGDGSALEAKWVDQEEVEMAEELASVGEEVAEPECAPVAGVVDADFAIVLVFQDYFHLIEFYINKFIKINSSNYCYGLNS